MILITAENRPSMSEMNLIHSVFAKPDVAIQMRPNPGYQEGAILALVEAYRNRWFEDYDWVVRVNPDVVIRDDTFLLQTMEDDSVSGIFDDCLEKACPAGRKCVDRLIHTDFFAIRPSAISRDEDSSVFRHSEKRFRRVVAKHGPAPRRMQGDGEIVTRCP
jgi:hypothetical protein